jgi:cytoskeletal protein CcmA (bactofilin family)
MTHFDEAACMLYLDGQLDAQQAAELSAHTAVCSDCRALLSALEKESRLIGQALIEQDEPLPLRLRTAPWPAPAAPAPASASWALWAWALSFSLAAAAGLALWTSIVQPLAEQLDQVGFQASSLLSTALFSGALWEGWESMFEAMQYAAVISLGVLVLALWRPWRRQRMTIAIVLAGFVLLLGLPSGTSAAEIRRGPNAVVAAGETIDNDLIVFGSARIDGTVKGDVIAFTQNLTVNGHVTGDLILFAQSARVNGQVDGNVRAFCQSFFLDNGTAKNVTVFAQRFDLDPRATVGGGLIGLVQNAALAGKITRDLLFLSANTTLDGTVGGNVEFRGPRLEIGPTAQIAGRVHVIGQRNADVAEGAKLSQPVEFEFRPLRRPGRFGAGTFVFRQILAYGGAFLCGLLLIKLFPGLFAAGRKATQHVGMAMSIGALVLVSGIALIIFAILLIIVGTGAGIATLMLFGPILYGSQVFVGSYVGEMILHKSGEFAPSVGALALGLLIVRLLSNIPFLGFFVLATVMIWGTGAICMAFWNRTRLDAASAA